jgi:uncharacterized membrane protein YccC
VTPESVTWIQTLTDAGLSAVLAFFVWVLWRELKAERELNRVLQEQMRDRQQAASEVRTAELREVLPIMRDSTQALARTTIILEQQQMARPPSTGSG